MFPPQPNDPHRLVTQPLSLQCYPQYSRSDDISLVYSSSVSEAATVPIKNESLYTTFMVYFMDYRPPNISYQFVTQNQPEGLIIKHSEQTIFLFKELFFLKRRKGETLRPSKLGTFTTPSLHLSYKGKNVLGNNQTFL